MLRSTIILAPLAHTVRFGRWIYQAKSDIHSFDRVSWGSLVLRLLTMVVAFILTAVLLLSSSVFSWILLTIAVVGWVDASYERGYRFSVNAATGMAWGLALTLLGQVIPGLRGPGIIACLVVICVLFGFARGSQLVEAEHQRRQAGNAYRDSAQRRQPTERR